MLECPKCNHETRVVDSRSRAGSIICRRRECIKCKLRFNTWESPQNIDVVASLLRKSRRRLDNMKEQAESIVAMLE